MRLKSNDDGRAMTDLPCDDEAYDDEDEGPSLAYPPIYVLRSADDCPVCGQPNFVYALGCVAFRDRREGGAPIEDFHFLRYVESLPKPLLTLLKSKLPSFRLDRDRRGEKRYLMNHCACGAKLDDDFVAGDVGAAFFPDTPDGYRVFRLLQLPVDEPIPIEASYTLGGGEYLDFENTWTWS